MTPLLFVVAAMVGAMIRLVVGRLGCWWQALLFVNVAGATMLGYLTHAELSPATLTIAGTGFCGALTTYSSFAFETRLLGWRLGSAYAALTIGCVCAAASIGSTLV